MAAINALFTLAECCRCFIRACLGLHLSTVCRSLRIGRHVGSLVLPDKSTLSDLDVMRGDITPTLTVCRRKRGDPSSLCSFHVTKSDEIRQSTGNTWGGTRGVNHALHPKAAGSQQALIFGNLTFAHIIRPETTNFGTLTHVVEAEECLYMGHPRPIPKERGYNAPKLLVPSTYGILFDLERPTYVVYMCFRGPAILCKCVVTISHTNTCQRFLSILF